MLLRSRSIEAIFETEIRITFHELRARPSRPRAGHETLSGSTDRTNHQPSEQQPIDSKERMMTTATMSHAIPAPHLRLTARGRRVITSLAAVPLVIGALLFAINGGGATAGLGQGVAFEHVTVATGQSLWQLAETIAPAADPRDVIAAIMQVNQLASSDVYAGQELALPPQYTR
jgi:hypothetical protein